MRVLHYGTIGHGRLSRSHGVTEKVRTLLVSDEIDPKHPAISEYSQHYDIWHMVRQRDAMAYIKTLLPKLVIVDLDMPGLEIAQLVRAVRQVGPHDQVVLAGLSRDAIAVPENIIMRFDRIIAIQP